MRWTPRLLGLISLIISAVALFCLAGCGSATFDDTEDFTVTVAPASRNLTAGSFVEFQVTYPRTGTSAIWKDEAVVVDLPPGMTVTSSRPVPAGEREATMTLRVEAAEIIRDGPRNLRIRVLAQSEGLFGETFPVAEGFGNATVVISGGKYVDVNVTPDTDSIAQGAANSYQATFTPMGGFNGTIGIQTFWLRTGGTPVTGTVGGLPATLTLSTPQTLNFTVSPSAAEPVGSTSLRVSARFGSVAPYEIGGETSTIAITSPAAGPTFRLEASPASVTMPSLSSFPVTVRIVPEGGFSGTVTLEVLDVPAGWATVLDPAGPAYTVTAPTTASVQVMLTQNVSLGGTNTWTARVRATSGATTREILVPIEAT